MARIDVGTRRGSDRVEATSLANGQPCPRLRWARERKRHTAASRICKRSEGTLPRCCSGNGLQSGAVVPTANRDLLNRAF
jgi:hypothetical protein